MDRLLIRGGKKLQGTVQISGSKNAALPILVATLLTDEPCVIHRVPNLRDVRTTLKILEYLGKKVEYKNNTVTISANGELKNNLPYELVKQMRASFWVAGPLLTRFQTAEIPLPGGCAIGVRPVDIHLKGFEKLGATCETKGGNVIIRAEKLSPAKIVLRFPSVGATQNLLMCACLIEGETVLENVAKEPEIDDVVDFLNKMGADIHADEKGRLVIRGKKSLHGAEHTVVADRIESGSYMLAAAVTRGDVTVTGCIPEHNAILLEDLQEAGFPLTITKDSVRVHAYDGEIKPLRIRTAPYPGFATDLQAPWMTLMTLANGTAEVDEDIFENRFMYVPELVRMNADIKVDGRTAVICGKGKLVGAEVTATDLRAGAALLIAGLSAKGKSVINKAEYLNRGYNNICEKFAGLGANMYFDE